MYPSTEKYFQIKTVGKRWGRALQTSVWFGLCRACYEQVFGLLMQMYNANNDSYGNLFTVHSFLDFLFFSFFLCNYLGLLCLPFFPTEVHLLVYEPMPISEQVHIQSIKLRMWLTFPPDWELSGHGFLLVRQTGMICGKMVLLEWLCVCVCVFMDTIGFKEQNVLQKLCFVMTSLQKYEGGTSDFCCSTWKMTMVYPFI